MISIVLLMGAEGVGKSTVAEHLVKNHGFIELSFAAALRESAIAMWNGIASMTSQLPTLTIEDTQDHDVKERQIQDLVLAGRPFSPRVLLQWFGTDIMRNIVADDIWAHATIARLESEIKHGHVRFVFSDYRFPNELEILRSFLKKYETAMCLSVRLVRGDISPIELEEVKQTALKGHPSTRGWVELPADFEIVNPLSPATKESWLNKACEQIAHTLVIFHAARHDRAVWDRKVQGWAAEASARAAAAQWAAASGWAPSPR